MRGKYAPLAAALGAAAARGQHSLEWSFDDVAALVGPLPPSAASRQWWANGSHPQALAWREAGFHVEQVALDRQRVRFATGQRGGTYAGSRVVPTSAATPATEQPAVDAPVDVRLVMQWRDSGRVTLDSAGKLTFGTLCSVPGLYRLTLTGGDKGPRSAGVHRRN